MTRQSLSMERETWCPTSMSQSGCSAQEACREHEEAVIEEEGGAICGASPFSSRSSRIGQVEKGLREVKEYELVPVSPRIIIVKRYSPAPDILSQKLKTEGLR